MIVRRSVIEHECGVVENNFLFRFNEKQYDDSEIEYDYINDSVLQTIEKFIPLTEYGKMVYCIFDKDHLTELSPRLGNSLSKLYEKCQTYVETFKIRQGQGFYINPYYEENTVEMEFTSEFTDFMRRGGLLVRIGCRSKNGAHDICDWTKFEFSTLPSRAELMEDAELTYKDQSLRFPLVHKIDPYPFINSTHIL